jgi:hypothetical protein
LSDPLPIWSAPLPGILDTPSLNMLAGASGIGKTALISSLARIFHEGGKLWGHQITIPPAVGYIGADRGGASARLWFQAAGYPDIPQWNLIDDRSFDLAQLHNKRGGPGLLFHALEQLKLPYGSLIFVDPIALFVGSNLLDYRIVALACIEIQRWLEDHPYCLVGVCHTSKQKADAKDRYLRPQDRIMGTGALLGYTSTQMYLMGPEEAGRDDGKHTFLWNPHHRPEEHFALQRTNTGLFDVGNTQAAALIASALSPALASLLALLPPPTHAISTPALMQQLTDSGIARATLFRQLKELLQYGYAWSPKRGLWARTDKPYP